SYFAISLFFQGSVLILARAYFAKSDTIRPTLFSIFSLLSAWIFAKTISEPAGMGVAGLALAFSVGSMINATLLWLGSGLPLRQILRDSNNHSNFLPIIVCSFIAVIAAIGIRSIFDLFWVSLPGTRTNVQLLITLLTGFVVSGGVYLALASVFNLEQWQLIKDRKNSIEK
ncbi:hypothetical protein HY844_02480, partial [Candidatus Berkelbacteria bacterium]|nr:hypothetical protein [Candidatus Berkelbacteria bacterium]